MRSPRLLVVCALILAPVTGIPLSSTAPNAPPPAPGTASKSPGTIKQPINDSVSHLAIKSGQINSTTIETATLDISSPVTSDGSKLQRTYRIERFEAAYENASNQQAVVDAALNRSEDQVATLQKRQKEAIKGYNDGALSTRTFLRKLALITAKANQTKIFIKHVSRKPDYNRAKYLRGDLKSFTGPVRTRIRSALQGDPDAPKRYFVRTSSQGVVLGTIDDGQYVRETNLAGDRPKQNTTGSIDSYELIDIIHKSYPSSKEYGLNFKQFGDHYVYKLDHSHGRLRTYVDSRSGEIFYEKQVATISDERTVEGPQNTNGSFALTTHVTYPGGYMIVRLTEPETGNTVNGTITVENETVGTTEDGELYMLQPSNGTTINATVDTETVSVTLGKKPAGPPGPPQSDSAIESPERLLETEQRRAAKQAESLL